MTTLDRELLELAAKAAGADYTVGKAGNITIDTEIGGVSGDWNPLTDDGDALRLAVKLGIEIHPDREAGESCTAFMVSEYGYNTIEAWNDHDDDELAATRRAIVRAAAEIGRRLP